MAISDSKPDEFVYLICPYCSVRQGRYLKRTAAPQVILCDCEDHPGCDRYFVIQLRMEPVLQYYTIRERYDAEDKTEQGDDHE